MCHLGTAEIYAAHARLEALRYADHERLARLAQQPGRPLRARLAERLHALAARIDVPAQLEREPARRDEAGPHTPPVWPGCSSSALNASTAS